MFDGVPIVWQYVILANAAFGATMLFLFLYHRIIARRKRACDFAAACRDWGLNKLAQPVDDYSHGDYSGAIHGFVALAKEMQTPAGAATLLEGAVMKIVTHYAAEHATKAQELLDILQKGNALKPVVTPWKIVAP